MGLFSFAGTDQPTGRGFNDWLKGEEDKGQISTAPGAPTRTDLDYKIELLRKYMKSGGIKNLKEGYNELKEEGFIDEPYGVIAGLTMKKLQSSNPREYEAKAKELGLPSLETVAEMGDPNAWAIGDTDGLLKRMKMGSEQEALQGMYGLTEGADVLEEKGLVPQMLQKKKVDKDRIQADRKNRVAELKELEQVWKGYYAVSDPEDPSGYNLPWNVGGTVGEAGVGMGIGAVVAGLTKGKWQPMMAAGANTGLEVAKYQEHENKLEAGLGIASGGLDFAPELAKQAGKVMGKVPVLGNLVKGPLEMAGNIIGLGKNINPVRKGAAITNWLTYPFRGQAGKVRKTLDKNQADRAGNFFNLMGMGKRGSDSVDGSLDRLEMPFSWLKDPNFIADRISKDTGQSQLQQASKAIEKLNSSAFGMYNKAMDNIGPGAGEMLEKLKIKPDGSDASQFPFGEGIKRYIKKQQKLLQEQGQPFRDAYREIGDNIKMDGSNLQQQSLDLLKSPHAVRELDRIVRGTTASEARYTKEIAERLDFIKKDNLRIDADVNASADKLPMLNKDITQIMEGIKLKKDKLKGMDPSSSGYKDMKHQINGENIRLAKQQKRYRDMANQHSSNLSARNAHAAELKNIDETEIPKLNFENMSANQLVDIVESLNEKLYTRGSTLEALSNKDKSQLKQWRNSAKESLSSLDKNFSVPYNKAKTIEQTNFNLFKGEGGDNSIQGINEAMQDGISSKEMEDLFSGPEGLANLKKLGYILPSNTPEYRGMVRKHLNERFKPKTSQGEGGSPTFDFNDLSVQTEGVDFDDYRSLFPDGKSQGVDIISGLSGADLVTKGGIGDITKAMSKKGDLNQYEAPHLFSPVTDSFYMDPKNRPYGNYTGQGPTAVDYLMGSIRKMNPAESSPKILHSPEVESSALFKQQKIQRKIETGSEVIAPTKQASEGLDILDDIDYDWEYSGTNYNTQLW